jgi:hypothetical protein
MNYLCSFHSADRRGNDKRNSDDRRPNDRTTATARFLKDKRSGVKPEPEKTTKYQSSSSSDATLANAAARRSANHVRANRGDDVKKARKQVRIN